MIALALSITAASVSVVSAADARPNVVLIMADDLGWMDLHCQGNDTLDTPAIDQLASEGMRFTDGYAASPVCTPTRAAMMTGLAPARLAITNHAPGNPDFVSPKSKLRGAEWTTYLALEHTTIAERLKTAGYATGFIGKWHLSHRPGKDGDEKREPKLRPEHQGFDSNVGGCNYGGPPSYFEPYRIPNISPRRVGDYLPERLADESIDFLQRNRQHPFFLCWWNYSVHYPIEAPEHLIEKYKNREGVPHPAYAAMIEGMDTAIGRVLKTLDDLGLADNTLLIFTSDNGSLFGNEPLRRNKGHLYEGGIRVPWIVRWPGKVAPASVCDTPVISTDIVPTILATVDLDADSESFDGENLTPLLTQTGDLKRDAIFFHYPNYAFHKQNRLGSAIRRGNHKLIKWYDSDAVELYDLTQDLGEKTNLAQSKAALANSLQNDLDAWLKQTGAHHPSRQE
ncbi:MAG: sulfatase [Pirellulaceae bacterium]|nr:sulfatase [Pirellulaceae bacterium]